MSVAMTAYRFFRRFLHERDGGICGICHEPVALGRKMDIDHIVQLAEGGSDAPSNLRITHDRCNRKRPRIVGIPVWIDVPMADALALKQMADSQDFDVTPFLIHTLQRMVDERTRPSAP